MAKIRTKNVVKNKTKHLVISYFDNKEVISYYSDSLEMKDIIGEMKSEISEKGIVVNDDKIIYFNE